MTGSSSWISETPEVAAGGVEPESRALLVGGVEEVDVGHRRGEVATTDARGRGDQAEDPVGRRRVLHGVREQQRGHQQHRAADDRPVAAAELRHREGVRQPQQRADEVGERDEQEQLLRGEREALREQEGRARRSRSARPRSRRARRRSTRPGCGGRPAAGRLPEVGVLGAPVLDPAAGAAGRGRAHAGRASAPGVSARAARSGGGAVNFSSRPHEPPRPTPCRRPGSIGPDPHTRSPRVHSANARRTVRARCVGPRARLGVGERVLLG